MMMNMRTREFTQAMSVNKAWESNIHADSLPHTHKIISTHTHTHTHTHTVHFPSYLVASENRATIFTLV